nr:hypothetical protein [Tanacetum cinerariifolium]
MKTLPCEVIFLNCPKYGNPVDGQYCQGCALLRKELKEVWFTICEENGILKGLLDTSESSNDNTNVVNAPQEPFVFKQDPGKNSSQSPPHINYHCCYGSGDSLEDIFCHECTYESCRKGAHYGYNCSPIFPVIHQPIREKTCTELLAEGRAANINTQPFQYSVIHQPPQEEIKVLSLAWETTLEIEHAFEDKHCQPEDILELFQRLHNDVQNIHEELADFSDSNKDSTLIDDDSFYIDDIEYVEASPPDSELISLEAVEIVIPKVRGIDVDILLTIEDDILREKLLNVNLLIAKIKASKDNPTPSSDFVAKSSSTSLKFLLEETNTFDNSLPESKTFCFNL